MCLKWKWVNHTWIYTSIPICTLNTITHHDPIYGISKKEQGVSLDKEVALLKQAIFELNQKVESMKTDICAFRLFGFCLG